MDITCKKCRSWKNEYNVNCIGFSGNPNADILFVGEMAGRNEAIASQEIPTHFIGKAGKILNRLLKLVGLNRSDIAIVNSHKCYKTGNSKPTKKELDHCFENLMDDIESINPKLIISLGEIALYQLTNKEGIGNNRGKLVFSDKIKRKVFPVYHPMATGYDPKKWEILVEDFKRIPDLIDEKPFEIKHFKFEYVETKDHFYSILEELKKGRELFLDLESTGLDPYENEIVSLQLGTGKEPIYVLDGDLIKTVKDDLKELIENKDIIGQGWEFDVRFLRIHLGIFPKKWKFDCCLAEYMLTGMKHNDLSYLTYKYVPECGGYDDLVKFAGGFHNVKDVAVARQYSADDIGVMYTIRRKQYKALIKNDLLNIFENIKMPSNKVLTKMSLRGVLYDVGKLMEVDREYEKESTKAFNKIKDLISIKKCIKNFNKPFNPRSPLMVRWLMLDFYGLPVLKTTKKGNPSIGKDEMKIYAKKFKNPYAKSMEQYRSIESTRSNFLSGAIPKLKNNVAHTSYSLHATASGRPNSKDPNLLNIPDKSEIKECIIARPGYKYVYADLSQIEVRIAAAIYEEQRLIDLCNEEGKDFHSIIASKVYRIPYDEFYQKYLDGDKDIKEKRRKTKCIVFGVLYGETAFGLRYDLNVSLQKAQTFIDEFFDEFPDLKKNIEKTHEFVIKHGYNRTYFGFTRRWERHGRKDYNTLREAVNQRVQGSAWTLMELILIEVDQYLEDKKAKLVMQVYDSLTIEAPEEEVEEICIKIKEITENIVNPYEGLNKVKIKADIETGYDLANLKRV